MPPPLSRELAQRVIDQVAPTLEFNINVMDPSGVIIASTDAARIGSMHAVARAVAAGEPGIVHEAGPASERAGVNLPLRLDGDVVGVLGVTGPPERVAPVAQVLVLTTALLLEREREIDDTARRDAADRDLLGALVAGELEGPALSAALDSGLPELPPPWRLEAVLDDQVAGSVDSPGGPTPSGPHRRARFGGALWVLTGARSGSRLPEEPTKDSTSRVVLDGGTSTDALELAGSAQALGSLVAARGLLPLHDGRRTLQLVDLAPELSVAGLPPATVAALARRVAGLRPEHHRTVEAYLAGGSSTSATARQLYLHRNTAIQRLDRITELTGLDPRVPGQAATLQLAIVASRR
ncbi:CdaR family transcriptional regulator [Arthrobacter sp. JSM 101049]|uniref:CdaR family transcriptional regulator n=1 Tax=Arthrobacter sp. JSM 101049 TaxID=929097 RepID=UPI00356A1A87